MTYLAFSKNRVFGVLKVGADLGFGHFFWGKIEYVKQVSETRT
jgi:hypothetical protein